MTQFATLQAQYQKALRCFLLTKYTTAASVCVKTIALLPPSSEQSSSDTNVKLLEQLRFSIWTLYLNIATTLLAQDMLSTQTAKLLGLMSTEAKNNDEVALQVWQLLVDGYGESGNVDPRLISSCAIMTIKLQVVNVGRQVVEQWYAGLPDATMDYFSAIASQKDQQEPDVYYEGTLSALELYMTQILPAMGDYESAISFCQYNPLISESKKKSIYTAIEDHKESVVREKERKHEQQRKAEQQARLSREKEQARLESEARSRREGNKMNDTAAVPPQRGSQENYVNGLPSPALSASSSSSASEDGDQVISTAMPPSPSKDSLSTRVQRRSGPVAVKEWVRQALSRGTHSTLAVIFLVLMLLGLVRGSRGQWPQPIKAAFIKLWQTIQMGTKVTYL